MTTQATEAMRAVRERHDGAWSGTDDPWKRPGRPWFVVPDFPPGLGRVIGTGATEDEAWINAAAGLEGRG